MAERGFAVQELFADMGVKVTIPDFKGQGRSQLNKMEGKGSEKLQRQEFMLKGQFNQLKHFIF